MDFAASLLSFSTPTHIHDFDTELADCWKTASSMAAKLSILESMRITILRLSICLLDWVAS
jgi:hypothetical protein